MNTIKKIQVGGVDYDIQANELTKISYTDLKGKRDNSELVVGHLYRITDYQFTTIQEQTKSAEHPFDVIVLATAENQLSELARAIQREGDTYFDGNDLGAWELWYDLDNDTTKYEWAVDTESGRGVIYRMIDEKRNDCPYDFKNALFENTKLTSSTTSDKFYYTFSYVVGGKLYDGTVEKQVIACYDNSMGVYKKSGGKKSLNLNVFRNTSLTSICYSNIFGNNCYSNTFGNACGNNTFGYNCYSNIFGDDCDYNTFGHNCYSNKFGNTCYYNTFEKYCGNNTFGNYCGNNTFGYSCYSNKFGNTCYYNTFGNYCNDNIFGSNCQNNTFGSNCYYNTFGNYCNDNIFGDGVSNRDLVSSNNISITLNDEYYDDGSGQLVPIKHPDPSTQPSILPYKFMGQYVYEQLIPVKVGDIIVFCDFMVDHPMILSATVFGVNSFKNVDVRATKSDSLLLNTRNELEGYLNIKYTDGSQLLPSNGYGYGYEDNNIKSPISIDFGTFLENIYIYDPNTEVLSLYGRSSGKNSWVEFSVPQHLPKKNIVLGEGVVGFSPLITDLNDDIENFTLASSVTSIANNAFKQCTSLKNLIIPEDSQLTSIGTDAFQGCSSLTSIAIPVGVMSIGTYAFMDCSSLESVTIPINSQLTSIEANTFKNCSSLERFTIPINSPLMNIGTYAFQNCSSLTSITIPKNVTDIGTYAFDDCGSLTAVTMHIDSQLTRIGNYAFRYCSSLTSITIPKNVTSIGNSTFQNCISLTSITIPKGVTSIGTSAFRYCSSLTSITIPEGVTGIGSSTFQGCSSLTSITIPEGVTSIGSSAFNACSSLTSITIPASVTSIGTMAFQNCSNLTSITCKATTPTSISGNTFTNVNKSIPVYVPSASIAAYKAATGWSSFTNIQAI